MPFLSKDWRSPGEEWVRYEGGWEKRKTIISVPGSDAEATNRLSPSLDLAEIDIQNIPTGIPKKILRRQSSKFKSNDVIMSTSKSDTNQNEVDFPGTYENTSNTKENVDSYNMDQDVKQTSADNFENKAQFNVPLATASPETENSPPQIIGGCRPKIKTKPIVIPKSNSENNNNDEEADIKPLKTRYSFSNITIPERLSSTLPRRIETMSDKTSNQDIKDISSVEDFSDWEEDNEFDDEYEKINYPLRYQLKQHFRMRRRQRSQRSLKTNESSHQQSEIDKASPTYKIECDSNYDARRSSKEGDVLANNIGHRRDSVTNPQRSSASPNSNIWLRLVEDEENIGNV